MSQTLTAPGKRRSTLFAAGSLFMGPKASHYRRSDGALAVEKQAVFRTGTFRDSTGRQGTWEHLHIDQMVANYSLLKGRGLLTDIPVRDGHPGFLISGMEGSGRVVGWHTDLQAETLETERGEVRYLLASYVLTEPDAAERYERGTYRNRSSEIGTYFTNDEAEFWPAYMGFAFVDIPAVEGLNSVEFSKSTSAAYAERDVIFLFDRENPLSTPTQPATGAPLLPLFGQPQQQPPSQPVNPPSPVQSFMLNGAPVGDAGQVQAHITMLENFRSETLEAGRVDFVAGLVTQGKIMATQKDAMTAFAKGLSDEQFASWKTAMSAAPQLPIFGQHGAGGSPAAPPATGAPSANTELESAQAIVRMHQLAGKDEEFIKGTESYKTVQRLTAAAK